MFAPKQPQQKFLNLKLCIPVSLGSEDFQGEKLKKLLQFAQRFPIVEFQLADGTLHAENLKIFYPDLSDEELIEKSNGIGKKWWGDNLSTIIEFLGEPAKSEPGHWNWTEQDDYEENLKKFELFLEENPKSKIATALKKTKEEVMPRFLKRLGLGKINESFKNGAVGRQVKIIAKEQQVPLEEAEKLFIQKYAQKKIEELDEKFGENFVSRQIEKYLKQEVVVVHYSDCWAKLGYNRLAYPNKITPVLQIASKEFSQKKYDDLLKWMPVRVTPKKKKMKVFTNDVVSQKMLSQQGIFSPNSPTGNVHFNFNVNTFKKQAIMQFYITLMNQLSLIPKSEHSSFIFSVLKTLTSLCPDQVQIDETRGEIKNPKFRIRPEESTDRLIFQYGYY